MKGRTTVMRKLRPIYMSPTLGAAALTTLVLSCASQKQEAEPLPDPYAPFDVEDDTGLGEAPDTLPPDTGEPPLDDGYPDSGNGTEDPASPKEPAFPQDPATPQGGPAQ